MMMLRYQFGAVDAVSGVIFIVGLTSLQYNVTIGLILLGIAVLKQFSGL